MTARWRVCTGLALGMLASSGQAQGQAEANLPLAAEDAQVLVDTARLEAHWQTPITLAQSLCLQAQLGAPGLRAVAGEAPINDRMADRMRRAWEHCTPVPDEAPDVRLVREARTRYQAAVLRLQGPVQQLRACRQEAPDKAGALACLQRVLGRAPSDTERQWLLALAPQRP
jgi:hypothetical protein